MSNGGVLRHFYSTVFPTDNVVKLITHNRKYALQNVRFGFRWGEDIFKRDIRFMDIADLQATLIRQAPSTINVEFPENARPLVFDIDIHDYNADRSCNCEPKQVCNVCWVEIMRPEMIKARDFLCGFIGFKEVMFVFSGRKGFHIWVTDDCVWSWDLNARLNYAERIPVRCDVPITAGKGHLVKLPWVLHQTTGEMACVIENIETFLPWMG